MSSFQLQTKVQRQNPDWTYVISQLSKQIEKTPWWGGKSKITTTYYEIKVRGFATGMEDRDTDYHDFDRMLTEPLQGAELEQFIDEIHQKVRAGKSEKDWEAIEKEKTNKAKAELEERLRREFEKKMEEEKARLEKQIRDELAKDKIGIAAMMERSLKVV